MLRDDPRTVPEEFAFNENLFLQSTKPRMTTICFWAIVSRLILAGRAPPARLFRRASDYALVINGLKKQARRLRSQRD
jgi:hypothetical protein